MEELLEELIKEALLLEVTDLHFKSQNEPIIYMRLKNQLQIFKTLTLEKYQRLMTYLKYKAKLDFNCLSQPQTGAFQLKIKDEMFYFRLSYLPSNNDVHLVLRLLNHHTKISFEQLSRHQSDLNTFKHLLKKESGLIVVCGPTGSGKSTTLHSFLEEIEKQSHKNIVTIEDPVEIHLDNVIQIQVNETSGLTFERILDQVLRHDPDVIMIGELRNEYSANIALKLSLTGHLVLTTLHASDGKTALKRLETLGISQDDLSQVLLSIISQRLCYEAVSQNPLVIFEILLKQDIYNVLMNQATSYQTLKDKVKEAYEMGWLSEEDYQKLT